MRPSPRFWFRQIAYDLSSGLFFRPALLIAAFGSLAAVVTGTVSHRLGVAWLFPGEASSAQLVLGTIASSMMTVISVVYSILLVALSLASMQFSTRILRELVRDPTSQVTLGVFVGTFVYCLFVLRIVQSGPPPVIPAIGVAIGIGLAMLAMGQLVYFIHHIAQLIQANHLLDRIAVEAELVIDAVFPEAAPETHPLPAELASLPHRPVLAEGAGYVQVIDQESLLELAHRLDAVIVVRARIGRFVTAGLPLVEVHSRTELSSREHEEIRAAFDLGPIRTFQDDAEWGLRQLVDIALKALSPAVNDPSTACTCVDQLGRLLVRAALRHDPPTSLAARGQTAARLVSELTSLPTLVDLAFTQIRQYGAGDMAVTIRQLRWLADLATVTDREDVRSRLLLHGRLAFEAATRRFDPADCQELEVRYRALHTALGLS